MRRGYDQLHPSPCQLADACCECEFISALHSPSGDFDRIVKACIPDEVEFSHGSNEMPFDISSKEHTPMTFRAC